MNLQEFQQLSKRTMPFGGEPANQVEFENMLGNYAMGLTGELIEFVNVANSDVPVYENFILEAGDVMHYAVGLLALVGETADETKIPNRIENGILVSEAGEVLEIAKKHIYHRHELNQDAIIENVYLTIAFFYHDESLEFEEILETNIDKLKTRYPDKFNTADSIARKDVQA